MMIEHQISSPSLSAPRTVWIHPASAGPAKDCLLFLDGELYTDRVKAPEILQEAQASGTLPSMTCVYLSSVSAANRQMEYTCNEGFASFLVTDMARWIECQAGRHERLFLCGLSLSALQALFTTLHAPGVFAGALSQSPSAWWQDEWLAGNIPCTTTRGNRLWISVGTHEVQENVSHPPTPLVQKTSQLDSVRHLVNRMSAAGHQIRSHEYNGGHDPTCWGAELPEALAWLTGPS